MALTYLKQTWFFFRANLQPIMKIQLPFIIAISLISMTAMQSVDSENPEMNSSVMMFYLASLIFLPLYAGATIAYLESVIQDKPITPLQALKIGLTRWGPLFLTKIIGAIGIVIGLFLFFIPGIYVMVRWAFAEYQCIVQNDGPIDALKNSWDDTQDYFWLLLNGLATLFVILVGANILIEWLLSAIGIQSLLIRGMLDVVFAFLNCLYSIYGFRLYCVMREGS